MYYTIFILTLIDVALTTFGLNKGYVYEANPLIAKLIKVSLPLTMVGVLIFTAIALVFIHYFERQYQWVRYGLWIVLASKIVVLMFHFIWIRQVMTCTRL